MSQNLALYIQGSIYPSQTTGPNAGCNTSGDPATTVENVAGSGFTTAILALFHVNADASINFNNCPVASGGAYVGDPSWPDEISALKQSGSSVTKIFGSIGGGGVGDYGNIENLIQQYGTGSDSPLYQNMLALKNAVPIDGIDLDDEDNYDQDTIVQYSLMLNGMGLEVTFCPYTQQSFWVGCLDAVTAQGGSVSWFNLQCYSGGAGNDPASWAAAINPVPVVPGMSSDSSSDQVCSQFQEWADEVNGGFIWTYKGIADDTAAYASAIANGLDKNCSDS